MTDSRRRISNGGGDCRGLRRHPPEPGPAAMRRAIQAARETMTAGDGGPFGACIVRDGCVIAIAGNEVLRSHDPTAHAEITAIRHACAEVESHVLAGADIYSTTEPCPMCFAAIHWARVARIIYGTRIADVRRLGFNELTVSNARMRRIGGSMVELVPGFLLDECRALLREWESLPGRQTY